MRAEDRELLKLAAIAGGYSHLEYVEGGYEPGNCRWATASEQRRNQRPMLIVLAAAEIAKSKGAQ